MIGFVTPFLAEKTCAISSRLSTGETMVRSPSAITPSRIGFKEAVEELLFDQAAGFFFLLVSHEREPHHPNTPGLVVLLYIVELSLKSMNLSIPIFEQGAKLSILGLRVCHQFL
jgi:hypothetical protein